MKLTFASAFIAIASSVAMAEEPEPTLAPDGDKKLESTAIDPRKDEESSDGKRYLLAGGELAAVLGISAAWYWSDLEMQRPDWALKWDWESWKQKLNGEGIRFDSNPFHINVGHTTQALEAYMIGRGNGFGFTGAMLLNVAYTFLWEYTIEFREYVSINDLIVNSVSGPALGEPLWQVGDYFRSGKKTWYNEGLAAFFQPFDTIERKVNGRKWRESARPWHRFRVSAGSSSQTAEASGMPTGKTNAAEVDVDLEVVSFDRSGARDGWTPAGGWSRIAGGLRFNGDGLDGGHLHSHTSYGGYQSRAIYEDGMGRSAFIGFGTGMTLEISDLGMETDRFAAYHVIGPQADLHLRTKNVDFRWQAAAYGDLALVDAYALALMPPIDAEPPFESPLTGHGYYFGLGGTGWTRFLIQSHGAHLDLEAHVHQALSIDQKNNGRGEPEPPKDLADGRFYGTAKLGYAVLRNLAVDGVYNVAARRGTVGDEERTGTEHRYGLMLTLMH